MLTLTLGGELARGAAQGSEGWADNVRAAASGQVEWAAASAAGGGYPTLQSDRRPHPNVFAPPRPRRAPSNTKTARPPQVVRGLTSWSRTRAGRRRAAFATAAIVLRKQLRGWRGGGRPKPRDPTTKLPNGWPIALNPNVFAHGHSPLGWGGGRGGLRERVGDGRWWRSGWRACGRLPTARQRFVWCEQRRGMAQLALGGAP